MNRSTSAASGLIWGLVGGLLDFASGAQLSLGGMQQTPMENTIVSPQNGVIALGLFALGAIVIITAVASMMPVGRGHPRLFSVLMVVYGLVMLLVGASMVGGLVAMMSTPYLGYAMLVVGTLMIVNGSYMSRAPMRM